MRALSDPLLGRSERRRLDVAGAHSPDFLRSNQAARLEHLEVLSDGRKRHHEGLGELAHRRWSPVQPLRHEPTRGVRQRAEHKVKRVQLIQHLLK